jgi:hypothetical protein
MEPTSALVAPAAIEAPWDLAAVTKVADLVAQTAHLIVMQMFQNYLATKMEEMRAGQKFTDAQIAAMRNSIVVPLEYSNESAADSQMVLAMLFQATMSQVKKVSPPLMHFFEQINLQTGNDQTSNNYIMSYVLPATHQMMNRLRTDYHPMAIEDKRIWSLKG